MLKKVINIVFPKECVNCGKKSEYICKNCLKNISDHPEICPFCNRYSKNFKICSDCKNNKEIYVNGIHICAQYEGIVKKLVLKLKYYHKKDIANFFIKKIYLNIISNDILNNVIESNKILISSVPSHWSRKYLIKGYNQSEILAKKLANEIGLPYIQICNKKKYSKSQISLNKKQRLLNLKNTFKIKEGVSIDKYDYIFIIDDITTTGSTINEIAKCIKANFKNAQIRGIVIGRHGK